MRPVMVFDIECYVNYYLVCFKQIGVATGTSYEFPFSEKDKDEIREIIRCYRLVGFNSMHYDFPLVLLSLRDGVTVKNLKDASNDIIVNGLKYWGFEKKYFVKVDGGNADHIDLIEVAPLTASLKAYGARLHVRSIQDLPLDPYAEVSEDMKGVLRLYCQNDLVNTQALYTALLPQLALREAMGASYGLNLMSKSDAQIAEAVIKTEIKTLTGHDVQKPGESVRNDFQYTAPSWLQFQSPQLTDMLARIVGETFMLSEKGSVMMPDSLKGKGGTVALAGKKYVMGIGGLHSCEKRQVKQADETHRIFDVDVASYYPSLILTLGLYPQHLGAIFLTVFRQIVEKRLAAKKRVEELRKEIVSIKQHLERLKREE